jgi:predicted transcriptional regulator
MIFRLRYKEKLEPSSQSRRFILLLFIALISSFILLVSILILLFASIEQTFGPIETPAIWIIIILISITACILLIIGILSLSEYKAHILRTNFRMKSNPYLTLDKIFENEARMRIINEILNNPGIHHNKLLQDCNLQKGQLQWHLDVLLKNHIIKQANVGHFVVYFPVMNAYQSIDKLQIELEKSDTTRQILALINNNPGIRPSQISNLVNLARTTVKYHAEKLLSKDLITLEKRGRKIKFYPLKNDID